MDLSSQDNGSQTASSLNIILMQYSSSVARDEELCFVRLCDEISF